MLQFRRLWLTRFLALTILPLEPGHWHETSFWFKKAPDFQFTKQGLSIQTEAAVGGYFYLLPQARDLGPETWLQVKIQILKQGPGPVAIPFLKQEDDYALRIGLVLAGGPPAKIPKLVAKKLPVKTAISQVLYYNFRQQSSKEIDCGASPHNDYATYCLVSVGEGEQEIVLKPWLDLKRSPVKPTMLKPELLGIWLFADTDDTKVLASARLLSLGIGEP